MRRVVGEAALRLAPRLATADVLAPRLYLDAMTKSSRFPATARRYGAFGVRNSGISSPVSLRLFITFSCVSGPT
jgi:hypothetical protein